MKSIQFSRTKSSHNSGFIALISVVLVSAFLLTAVLEHTNFVAALFDETNHKQRRFLAVQSALACLDTVVLEFTHDYFFEVTSSDISSGVSYQRTDCSIVSVGETSGGVPGDGRRTVVVTGNFSGVRATITADVMLSDRKISLISQKTFF